MCATSEMPPAQNLGSPWPRDVVAKLGREFAFDGRDVDPDFSKTRPRMIEIVPPPAARTLPRGAFERPAGPSVGRSPGKFISIARTPSRSRSRSSANQVSTLAQRDGIGGKRLQLRS